MRLVMLKHMAPANGLSKDWGMLPFLLGRHHGWDVTIYLPATYRFSDADRELLDGLMHGYDVRLLEEGISPQEAGDKILNEQATEIDVLFVFGLYDENRHWAARYKALHPGGFVYCKLDLNPHWLSRWDFHPKLGNISLKDIDLLSAESPDMCRAFTERSGRVADCIPNGYHPALYKPEGCWEAKKDIFLTVGRLGIVEKDNLTALEAFARVANRLPGWSFRLVGPVCDDFVPVLTEFQRTHPHLENRIEFTGMILDKAAVRQEYRQAKVFVMSSLIEAMAHVYLEALTAGCALVVSAVAGMNEVTDRQRLGRIFPIGDSAAMAEAMLAMATDSAALERICTEAPQYAAGRFNWLSIAHRADTLIRSMKEAR